MPNVMPAMSGSIRPAAIVPLLPPTGFDAGTSSQPQFGAARPSTLSGPQQDQFLSASNMFGLGQSGGFPATTTSFPQASNAASSLGGNNPFALSGLGGSGLTGSGLSGSNANASSLMANSPLSQSGDGSTDSAGDLMGQLVNTIKTFIEQLMEQLKPLLENAGQQGQQNPETGGEQNASPSSGGGSEGASGEDSGGGECGEQSDCGSCEESGESGGGSEGASGDAASGDAQSGSQSPANGATAAGAGTPSTGAGGDFNQPAAAPGGRVVYESMDGTRGNTDNELQDKSGAFSTQNGMADVNIDTSTLGPDNLRSEVMGPDLEMGKEYSYQYSFRMDPDSESNPGDDIIIGQVHGDDTDSPPIAVRVHTDDDGVDRMYLDVRHSPDDQESWKDHPLGEVRPGEVNNIDIRFKTSKGPDGYAAVSVNGEERANVQGPTVYSGNEGAGYIKWGIYDWGYDDSASQRKHAQFDNVRLTELG